MRCGQFPGVTAPTWRQNRKLHRTSRQRPCGAVDYKATQIPVLSRMHQSKGDALAGTLIGTLIEIGRGF
jgi:hypothetical protein